jgi:hypothetical protein
LVFNEGHTIAGLFTSLRMNQDQILLKPFINPCEVQVGLQITFRCTSTPMGENSRLQFLSSPEMGLEIKLTEQNDRFKAQKVNYRLHKRQVVLNGAINLSLYQDALKRGQSPCFA